MAKHPSRLIKSRLEGEGELREFTSSDEMVTVQEMTRLVKMSPPTIRKYARNGDFERAGIRTICIGKKIRFAREDVHRIVRGEE